MLIKPIKDDRIYSLCQTLCSPYDNNMEGIKPNPILKFNENQLQDVRKALGYEDVNKLKQDIENLRDWIQKQNHFRVKEFDDEQLERFLIYNKGSIERTKQKFDRLCTCTNMMPEFLQNFDVKNEFYAIHTITHNFVMPKPTKDNYRLLISICTGLDHKDFQTIQFYRYLIVLGHYILRNDYCHGYEWVADTSKLTMGTVTKLNPIVIHKALTLIIEAMGQRMRKIHLISGSKFFDVMLTIFKQGLSAKLKERLVIHPNFESLYEQVPKEYLPKEFGGEEGTVKEINDIVFDELCTDKSIEHLKAMENIATDESCRLPCKFNEEYSGMPGSFKSLCVD